MSQRHDFRGYVVGSNRGGKEWVVRIKDADPQWDRRKLNVGSVHVGTVLRAGLEVSFYLSSADSVAYDVTEISQPKTQVELRSEVMPSDCDSLSLVVLRFVDGEGVYLTSSDTEQEAQRDVSGLDGKVIGFAKFDIREFQEEILDFENAQAGFNAIRSLINIDGVNRALEQLLNLAYELGKTSRKE